MKEHLLTELKKDHVIILKANFSLRMKVGEGTIAPKVLLDCARLVEENAFDFRPLGRDIIKTIRSEIKHGYSQDKTDQTQLLDTILVQLMQFKANAAVFHHPVLSEIAEKLLYFFDNVKQFDQESVEILHAFCDAADKLLARENSAYGSDKPAIRQIAKEFENAFLRYRKRYVQDN